MYDNILIPTDGSDEAEAAVSHGIALAKAFDAKAHALYVIETQATYILTAELGDQEMEQYRDYGEQVVEDVAERAAAEGLDATGVIKVGKISEEIVEYAHNQEVDTIVMGRRGRGSIEQYLGSITEKVVRRAKVPVTVVGGGSL